ncbi:MAG: proteasome accessory factor PafA2 family protein [Myxococcota bacterium]|nr:proteasome accessory factor PafA2 family protein [Myxococcota bacterium]
MQDRVFGIETEYAVIYHPGRGETRRPSNLSLYQLFEPLLAEEVRGVPMAFSLLRSKTGRFLENGGTFHYEGTPTEYEHGLIEMASPECRDPFTLLACERAKDELVESLAARVTERLPELGYRGEVRIGKNNTDSQGHTFGSHESYWVEDPLDGWHKLALAPLWGLAWALTLPVLLWVVVASILVMALGVAVLFTPVVGFLLGLLSRGLAGPAPRFARSLALRSRRLAAIPGRLARRLEREPGWLGRKLHWLEAPLRPAVGLHSWLHNRFHFRALHRCLTAFLVTRTVYTGAGAVVLDGSAPFQIAQRPRFLRSFARIFTSGDDRPLYESRDVFFRPFSAFQRHRRLHLLLGDANLCDWALVLRTGATALVLEAIEAEPGAGWPVLADPLDALARLAADPELETPLRLADGSRKSAIAIQREVLGHVRRALSRTGSLADGPAWKGRVMQMWEETLDALEEDPASLADRIDWIAKRSLLEGDVPDALAWNELREGGAAAVATSAAEALDRGLRERAFRALRTDLRYHELGPRGGYRRLERRGAVRRLSDPALVARAHVEPPGDTRAYGRGRAIREICLGRGRGGASWHRVRAGLRHWRFFGDPLSPRATLELGRPERSEV